MPQQPAQQRYPTGGQTAYLSQQQPLGMMPRQGQQQPQQGGQAQQMPNMFGAANDFMQEFQSNAATQIGMQIGSKAFTQGQQIVQQNINRYINIPQLKYYFNVSNTYVLQKIRVLLFPFRRKGGWSRLVLRSEQNGQVEGFKPPRDDLNAPDLYIPVMSFVTYVLLVAILLGAGQNFTPDVLGMTSTTALFIIAFEVVFIKLGIYLLSVNAEAPILDLIAYCGYKFIGLICTQLMKLISKDYLYVYSIFAYCMACFFLFT
ncbi:Protein yif1b, partial [Quaeritorhiza haematococci]